MDDKTYYGSLAEAKVIAELTKQRFYVFNQVSGKAPIDLIALKGNETLRISVKSTTVRAPSGAFAVQIGRVRSNKKSNFVYKFDPTTCEYVAIYLVELDKICFVKSSEIQTSRYFSIKEDDIDKYRNVEGIA